MSIRRALAILAAFLLLAAGGAHAEKADSDKPIQISADFTEQDGVKQIRVYTGNVVIIQGTLIMKGDKLVLTTSPDGYDFATLSAPAGGAATMRQKRDGGPDLWMEGEAANRITYDQKTAVAVLYSHAKVRRLTGDRTTDESIGAYLSYNGQTEVVTGANAENGVSIPGGGRVSVVIQPRQHAEPK